MEYRVKLYPDGPEGKAKPDQNVNAESEKAAAEKLHGGPLYEQGANHQLRAEARVIIAGKSLPKKSFYEK
jgi:hypothetical protein